MCAYKAGFLTFARCLSKMRERANVESQLMSIQNVRDSISQVTSNAQAAVSNRNTWASIMGMNQNSWMNAANNSLFGGGTPVANPGDMLSLVNNAYGSSSSANGASTNNLFAANNAYGAYNSTGVGSLNSQATLGLGSYSTPFSSYYTSYPSSYTSLIGQITNSSGMPYAMANGLFGDASLSGIFNGHGMFDQTQINLLSGFENVLEIRQNNLQTRLKKIETEIENLEKASSNNEGTKYKWG